MSARRAAARRWAAVAGMMFALGACGSPPEGQLVCVAFFDVSPSVDEKVRRAYLEEFEKFAAYCAERDSVVHVDLISKDTMRMPVPPITADFSALEHSDNPLYGPASRHEAVDALIGKATAVVMDPANRSNGTDIFGALVVAARKFGAGEGPRRVLLLSDGLQSADPFNLTLRDLTDPAVTEEVIAETRRQGLHVDLGDAIVDFAGANVTLEHRVSREGLLAFESFWRRYLPLVRAELGAYDKGWQPPAN